jgi:hypothetical protein
LQDVLPEHLQSPCVTEEKTKENVQRKCSVGMDLMTNQVPEHNPLQLSNLPHRLYALHCVALCCVLIIIPITFSCLLHTLYSHWLDLHLIPSQKQCCT